MASRSVLDTSGRPDDGLGRAGSRRRELDEVVVLEEVTDHGRGVGLARQRRGQHQARRAQSVAFDDAGQDGTQLVAGGVVGVVTELLDAVGQRGVRQHQGDALHRAVDATLGRGLADGVRRGVTAGQPLDGLSVVVTEGGHDACQLVVGGRAQGPVEQPERLQAGLHLVHGPRRYRSSAPTPTPLDQRRSTPAVIP